MSFQNRYDYTRPAPQTPLFKEVFPDFTTFKETILVGRTDGLYDTPLYEESDVKEVYYNRLRILCGNGQMKFMSIVDNKTNLLFAWESNWRTFKKLKELYNKDYTQWLKNVSNVESKNYGVGGIDGTVFTEDELSKFLNNRYKVESGTSPSLFASQEKVLKFVYQRTPEEMFLMLIKTDIMNIYTDSAGGQW